MTEVFAWLALLILLVLIELATMGLTTIWFAAGALVATIAAACGAPVLVQVILFLVVSVLDVYKRQQLEFLQAAEMRRV